MFINNNKAHLILSILANKESLHWRKLYEELKKITLTNISSSEYSQILKKLVEKGLISKEGGEIKGTKVNISITEKGLDYFRHQINIDGYGDYEKSKFLLLFLLGVGIRYDSKKLTIDEIKEIHSRNDYTSITINELQEDVFNNEYRLFGDMDLYFKNKNYSEKFNDVFDYLVKLEILILGEDNRYRLNAMFTDLLQKCHIFMHFLISFFIFIFSYIRKPNNDENEWFDNLFEAKYKNVIEIFCHKERYSVKEIKPSENVFYTLSSGKVLETHIKASLEKFINSLKIIEEEFSILIRDEQQRFIMDRLLDFIFPEFIRNYDSYIINLKIKSDSQYQWKKSSLPYLWFE